MMRRILRDRKGSMIILAPVILILLFTGIAFCCEYSRVQATAGGTRDAVQAAVTQACTDNSKNIYTGTREGYAGGYKLVDAGWKPDVSSGDVMAKVDKKLGTSHGVKTVNGKVCYKISGVSVDIQNAPLAPAGTGGGQQLTGTAAYTVTVPLQSAWSALPPISVREEVQSAYSPQGEGKGNSGVIEVSGVKLSDGSITLNKGATKVISASVAPADADSHRLSWTSSDTGVCTVTQTGAATGVGKGAAIVTAMSDNGRMASCTVTVVSPVAGISLDKTSVSMNKGASVALKATVLPSDASNQAVRWNVSDSSVCTVNQAGKVTAVKAGAATVTAMTQEGGYFANCRITVAIPASGLTLDKASLTLKEGESDKLTAAAYPSGAKPEVLWASSDSDVCTVGRDGTINAKSVGSAVISATVKGTGHTASCAVTVTPLLGPVQNLSAVILDGGSRDGGSDGVRFSEEYNAFVVDQLSISWTPPADTGSQNLSYDVQINGCGCETQDTSLTLNCPVNSGALSITVTARLSQYIGTPAATAYEVYTASDKRMVLLDAYSYMFKVLQYDGTYSYTQLWSYNIPPLEGPCHWDNNGNPDEWVTDVRYAGPQEDMRRVTVYHLKRT